MQFSKIKTKIKTLYYNIMYYKILRMYKDNCAGNSATIVSEI